MPNQYVNEFEKQQKLGRSYQESIVTAIDLLTIDLEKEGRSKSKNLFSLNMLRELKENLNKIGEPNDAVAIFDVLKESGNLDYVPKVSEFRHALLDIIGGISYSTRDSNVISPSAKDIIHEDASYQEQSKWVPYQIIS